MGKSETRNSATKEMFLEAASEVFAKEGYREGTVAKICEAAGANRAAVNYYFGDKESLYREVWKNALSTALEAYPLRPRDGNLGPEERLKVFMRSLQLRAFDPGAAGWFTRLMAFEITDPQEFLEEERSSVRELHDAYFESLMRDAARWGGDRGRPGTLSVHGDGAVARSWYTAVRGARQTHASRAVRARSRADGQPDVRVRSCRHREHEAGNESQGDRGRGGRRMNRMKRTTGLASALVVLALLAAGVAGCAAALSLSATIGSTWYRVAEATSA